MTPPTHLWDWAFGFLRKTYRFAPIFTAQFSNLLGGVMTPPYECAR